MILPMTNLKVRLIEIPRVPKEEGSKEMIEFGKFTVGKRYRVYSIYSEKAFTDFLVVDDNGIFYWISMAAFRK